MSTAAARPRSPAQRIPNPLQVIGIDCLPNLSATALQGRLRDRLGPLLGFDNPKLVPLGGNRTLWLLTDPYVDLSGANDGPLQPTDYVHNTLLLQEGHCFSLIQRVDGGLPWEFQPSISPQEWFWPLGGSIGQGGLLYVFWSRMVEDGAQAFLDGITRHPVQTWLGVYDPTSFATISFARAPNSGVFPQYGSAVQTAADGYSYLFGNSNMLELSREGGYGAPSPFSGTRMYVARVPAGQFQAAPQYWTGGGWSASAGAAAPFSSRWSISNAMQPRLIDGVWYSSVKRDEFWGDRVRRRTSRRAAGPVARDRRHPRRRRGAGRPRGRDDDDLPAGDRPPAGAERHAQRRAVAEQRGVAGVDGRPPPVPPAGAVGQGLTLTPAPG